MGLKQELCSSVNIKNCKTDLCKTILHPSLSLTRALYAKFQLELFCKEIIP